MVATMSYLINLQNSMQLHARRFTATIINIKFKVFFNKQISEAGMEIMVSQFKSVYRNIQLQLTVFR